MTRGGLSETALFNFEGRFLHSILAYWGPPVALCKHIGLNHSLVSITRLLFCQPALWQREESAPDLQRGLEGEGGGTLFQSRRSVGQASEGRNWESEALSKHLQSARG